MAASSPGDFFQYADALRDIPADGVQRKGVAFRILTDGPAVDPVDFAEKRGGVDKQMIKAVFRQRADFLFLALIAGMKGQIHLDQLFMKAGNGLETTGQIPPRAPVG